MKWTKAMKAAAAKAEAFGRAAFEAGKTRVPWHDADYRPMLKGVKVGDGVATALATAWLRGWDAGWAYQDRMERLAEDTRMGLGNALQELTDGGVDYSTALVMLNVD